MLLLPVMVAVLQWPARLPGGADGTQNKAQQSVGSTKSSASKCTLCLPCINPILVRQCCCCCCRCCWSRGWWHAKPTAIRTHPRNQAPPNARAAYLFPSGTNRRMRPMLPERHVP
ncbi:hypothetical protein PF010_g971 [Phytophthora fragariae]|uniref:Secreted protein n=1 Tax=Phytophthora fragariae TaxID=53985 RepID=A0A6G0M234_9STRA|nr:hypothetical protein PF010_g971 [Phytophthora fragariae]